MCALLAPTLDVCMYNFIDSGYKCVWVEMRTEGRKCIMSFSGCPARLGLVSYRGELQLQGEGMLLLKGLVSLGTQAILFQSPSEEVHGERCCHIHSE